VFGSQRDARAIHLGIVYLCAAAAFADPMLLTLTKSDTKFLAALALPIAALQPEAFLPYFVWLFSKDFPRTSVERKGGYPLQLVLSFSWILGLMLFLISAVVSLSDNVVNTNLPAFVSVIARNVPDNQFWTLIFGMTIPALPFIAWKASQAQPRERRRARLFVGTLVLAGAPICIEIILEGLIPAFKAFIDRPAARLSGAFVAYPLILSVPIITTYAVLAHQVLDVRLVVRRALQYALARYTLLLAAIGPFAALLWYLYSHRNHTVAELLAGTRLLIFFLSGVLALAFLKLRVPFLNLLDRRFFREHFDSHRILTELMENSRSAASPEELAGMFLTQIDRVLHLRSLAVMILDPATNMLVSLTGNVKPLSAFSPLAKFVANTSKPMEVNFKENSGFTSLPEEDQQWLNEGSFRLLVPLVSSDGKALGLLALGEKKSELPFSKEDRMLLASLGASGSLTLENRLLRTPITPVVIGPEDTPFEPRQTTIAETAASECPRCASVYPANTEECNVCDIKLVPAKVPYYLQNKFQFVRRVGQGGMGVVYQAQDLVLGRTVAVKTLPRLSPNGLVRLRHEAKSMAAVSHPNLALILGSETWMGTPLLVFEYLGGGTLADRLRTGPLSISEGIALGIQLADALSTLHRARILHRDIKPSNIGYTRDGIPKLLDFGLARILVGQGSRQKRGARFLIHFNESTSNDNTVSRTTLTADGNLVGTPLYLSPEAVLSKTPDVSFDLWALSLSLYEGIAGRNPVYGGSLQETLNRIVNEQICDIRTYRSDCPNSVSVFFESALARNQSLRPENADEMKQILNAVLADIQ
jgi:hypothetical protein